MANNPSSIAHLASDPLRNFKYEVTISHPDSAITKGFARMGFMSVSGLNVTTEVIPYREGGMNTTTQKMPGQSDFAPITLAKGLCIGDGAMILWMKELFTVMQGTGTGKPGQDFRADLTVYVLDHPVTDRTVAKTPRKAGFKVYNAWPTAISFSDLDAGANAIIVNQMTLAHEGWDTLLASSAGTSSVKF